MQIPGQLGHLISTVSQTDRQTARATLSSTLSQKDRQIGRQTQLSSRAYILHVKGVTQHHRETGTMKQVFGARLNPCPVDNIQMHTLAVTGSENTVYGTIQI